MRVARQNCAGTLARYQSGRSLFLGEGIADETIIRSSEVYAEKVAGISMVYQY